MQLLVDSEINEVQQASRMITPFVPYQVKYVPSINSAEPEDTRVISYGLSSCGYDFRLGTVFYRIPGQSFIDVKKGITVPMTNGPAAEPMTMFEQKSFFPMKPGDYLLGETLERWSLPDDVFALVIGKSTYARWGLILNVTPMEPGWRGVLTLELYNASQSHLFLYPGEGIGQAIFFRGKRPSTTYGDRGGKYQDQTGLTLGRA